MRNFFSSKQTRTRALWILFVALPALLGGCGGGSAGSAAGTTGGTTSGTTSGSTGSTAVATPNLKLSLVDGTGAAATDLTAGTPLAVQATLKDATGVLMPNVVVSFASGNASLATVTPSSALTDATGVASARIDAANVDAVGANYVTATTVFPADSTLSNVSADAPFQVGAATVDLAVSVSQSSISAYGTSSVSATVSINGAPPPAPMAVQFTSGCVSSGKASISSSVQTVNGVATATYTDKGCGQTDVISVSTGSVQKTVTITSAPPQAANIQFVSTTPSSLLVLKGTGGVGYSETAVVQFKVVDASGAGVANQTIDFGLTTSAGGITLDGQSIGSGSISKETDSTGAASVTVQSGTVPTAVWVTAKLGSLQTQSNKLVISTGRPSQDFFSLSATKLNIDGLRYDGATTVLNVYAADRLGNIVPDGTAINFVTDAGQIHGDSVGGTSSSTCSTVNGTCSVTLVSTNPRPANGRARVLAYTLGEESFVDSNGNNVYDPGESWDDLGNACIDANENTKCDPGEQVIEFNAANSSPCGVQPAKNNDAPSVANTCDGVWGPAHVRRNLTIVFSGTTASATPNIVSNAAVNPNGDCAYSFDFTLTDENGNAMPEGSTLALSGIVTVTGGGSGSPVSIAVTPATVPNTNGAGSVHQISVDAGSCGGVPPGTGSFTLSVTTPLTKKVTLIKFTVKP